MTQRTYDLSKKADVKAALRQAILMARLQLTLDKKRGRESSEINKRLAKMELPAGGNIEWKLRNTPVRSTEAQAIRKAAQANHPVH